MRLTSNSNLKLDVQIVGQEKSLGNIMKIGMGNPRATFPSPIWMVCISDAERENSDVIQWILFYIINYMKYCQVINF